MRRIALVAAIAAIISIPALADQIVTTQTTVAGGGTTQSSQEPSAPASSAPATPDKPSVPPPTMQSSDNCSFGIPADAHSIAAATHVTIVKCTATAGTALDQSTVDALGANKNTKSALSGIDQGDILATTTNGSNVTIYVNGK